MLVRRLCSHTNIPYNLGYHNSYQNYHLMRVLFAGTPDFSVPALEQLLIEHNIIGVFTQPDRQSGRGKKITMPPIKKVALFHNIPVHQPESLRNQASSIADLKPDVFIVVAYGMILPQEILDIPRLGCINIHASILPRWRGAAPIQRAIEAGDKETGVSIIQMAAGLDTGPVFQILKTDISQDDTSQSLHDRLAKLGAKGVCQTLTELSSENASVVAQKQIDDLATYAKKITKAEAQINWQNSATQLQQRIRAFNPWPICQTVHNDTRIRISKASLLPKMELLDKTPGQIIDVTDGQIIVACGNCDHSGKATALKLEILQRDGGKPLTSDVFLNGYPIKMGDKLT